MTTMPPPPSTPPNTPGGTPAPSASTYASWGSRALAYLIDGAIVAIPIFLLLLVGGLLTGLSIDEATGEMGTGGFAGIALVGLASVAGVAVQVWNVGWRQGETGQSIGKGILGITVIAKQGGYLGGGTGILRMLLNSILGGACFLNYLWPLWDDESQTWTDKIIDSIVVRS